jgi:hypothetical protein
LNKPISSPAASYGFISIREFEGVGYCGGLLIVSQLGRPLEFHCSAPVPPNRAQEILYGKTYPTFLFCEQIGLALIDKAKTQPDLYLTNLESLLALNSMVATPVVVIQSENDASPFSDSLESVSIGQQKIWYLNDSPDQHSASLQKVTDLLKRFTTTLTFDEPFERIEKAIEEAQAAAK